MGKKTKQKIKPIKAWVGICEGKMHCWGGEARYYEIYPTQALVKIAYEEYVQVLITPIPKRGHR